MTYNKENYASPSGLNLLELLRIQELLLSQSESIDDQRRRTELVEIVEKVQNRRLRQGLQLVAQSSRIIQELTVVFKLQRSGES